MKRVALPRCFAAGPQCRQDRSSWIRNQTHPPGMFHVYGWFLKWLHDSLQLIFNYLQLTNLVSLLVHIATRKQNVQESSVSPPCDTCKESIIIVTKPGPKTGRKAGITITMIIFMGLWSLSLLWHGYGSNLGTSIIGLLQLRYLKNVELLNGLYYLY